MRPGPAQTGSLLLLALLGSSGLQAAPGPDTPASSGPQLAWIERQSSWREHDERGALLLTEHGRLRGPQLGWHQTTALGRLELSWQQLDGVRDYTGQTSRGQPVTTLSTLQEESWSIRLATPLAPRWTLDLRLQSTRTRRTLADTATALGYTERWRWLLATTGLGWSLPLGAGRLDSRLELGSTLDNRLDTALPGVDPVVLHPQARPAMALQIDYRLSLPTLNGLPVQLQTGLRHQQLRFGASPAAALMRAGLLRGGVQQPATSLRDTSLQLGLQLRWP
jgi:hypothetical protein